MGWPFSQRDVQITPAELLGWRTQKRMPGLTQHITRERALRHSAVWACLRLRADLISTMPINVFRRVGGVQVEMPKPPVLVMPDSDRVDMLEWMYSTQVDLDSSGNTLGLVTARDGLGNPSRIDLVPIDDWVCQVRKGVVSYRVAGEEKAANEVWHERQYTVSGLPVGLSPIAFAAATVSGYLSAQDFAAEWFSGGGLPAAMLKNGARTISPDEARKVKDRFKASTSTGDVFVTGKDWDYSALSAKASEMQFLDAQKVSLGDISRYLGVPGDMIDVPIDGTSIKYANVTQRNLQLLITNIGPAVARRETALTKLTPQPRFVKLNPAALLRMDLQGRYASYGIAIDKRFLAPSEIRELEDRQPFTEEQEAEFARLFPTKASTPTPTSTPTGATS